ncbi:DNA replication/repair protein RecF [Thermomonas hydrothermalis]|uniref:DNA replication and repair protein RecF n=1 Tax=Thermomonas hydrothermalis TaxID=213588 RepID=A0A1M4TVH3_9GAMM|nr:DNA replication/repair protein RecF [Thermomonas hydrothermalis]SHE48445.1 DNA replication and repair protein RecF [Thermomonas hydrothermalis]
MLIRRLQIQALRRLDQVELALQPGFNLLLGDNGSGKTSVLEAVHLIGHARSFRGRVRDGLVRQGQPALSVFVEWERADGGCHRAGLRHSGQDWQARLDGRDVQQLGELCQALAVVTFEPGSHALVEGGGEMRRRYLDWSVFHVEHEFLPVWRRYARALKQRNILLRYRHGLEQLDAWEQELAQAGTAITQMRSACLAELKSQLDHLVPRLLPAAGGIDIELYPGWRQQTQSLEDALLLARERDLALGHTSVGPHRADLRIRLCDLPGREGLSRGQTKQLALALLLAQAAHLARVRGDWPILQLDDLGSELDRAHQQRVLDLLQTYDAQVLVTGTELPAGWCGSLPAAAVFHVEQGQIAGPVAPD